MDNWEKIKISSGAIAAILIPIIIVYVGNSYSTAIKEREVQGKFVELAVDILKSKPEEKTEKIRSWSVDIIDKYSGITMKQDARDLLIKSDPFPKYKRVCDYISRYVDSSNMAFESNGIERSLSSMAWFKNVSGDCQ